MITPLLLFAAITFTPASPTVGDPIAVNLPAGVTVHRSDNGHTGFFWTRPDRPIRPGPQPKMDAPGPDDWR